MNSRLKIQMDKEKGKGTHRFGEDGVGAGSTGGCRCKVVVVETENVSLLVHGEGLSIHAFIANGATKAARVVGLAHCANDLSKTDKSHIY